MDLWLRLRFTLLSRHRWRHSSHAELRDENFAGLCPLWYILFGTSYICPPPLGGSTSEFPRRFPTAGFPRPSGGKSRTRFERTPEPRVEARTFLPRRRTERI
jgi:hypothetical protein